MKAFHKHIPKNNSGRDFVVGDVHGCFTALSLLLEKVSFDTSKDRLFSVGDLVDRGYESHDSVKWIDKPWFHAVRGNHEDLVIGYVNGQVDQYMYNVNGGSWLIKSPRTEQINYAVMFDTLPVALTIQTDEEHPVGIVHADCPYDDWNKLISDLDEMSTEELPSLYDTHLLNTLMWSRSRAKNFGPYITNVSRVFVGHTPMDVPVVKQNVYFIDNGAVFGNELKLFDLKGNQVAAAHQPLQNTPTSTSW